MRINKYMASSGVSSRRKADELIRQGKVKVNGRILEKPGYEIKDGDRVEVEGQVIRPIEKKVYLMLNKPLGYVTTMDDEWGRPSVADLVTEIDTRLFPVGRLDCDTSGLLLMTNDGAFAEQVAHPSFGMEKTYRVVIEGGLGASSIEALQQGVDIGGFITGPAQVRGKKAGKGKTQVLLTIHEGKNRQIRRMFEAIDRKVLELERISIGSVHLGHLPQGRFRKLRPAEIESLIGKGN